MTYELDRNGARAVLALQYDITQTMEQEFSVACMLGAIELVKLLLASNLVQESVYDVALCHASEHGYVEIVQLLLDAGVDVHARDDYALRKASDG